MSKNIKDLVPKHRMDNFHLDELYELEEKDFKEIAYDLLAWLKDMSQPVSKELIPLLILKSNGLKEEIIKLLNNEKEDSILKYNIIHYILDEIDSSDLKKYNESLNRIVSNPTKYEKFYETNIVAKKVLNK